MQQQQVLLKQQGGKFSVEMGLHQLRRAWILVAEFRWH
jgi:hypothetical protein